jgi:hypothetical protein
MTDRPKRTDEDTENRVEQIIKMMRPSLFAAIKGRLTGQWRVELNFSEGGLNKPVVQIRQDLA